MAQSILVAPLQLPAAIGEMAAQFVVLGLRGILRALNRKASPKGDLILATYSHFCGDSVLHRFSNPGNDIGDHLSTAAWSLIHWARHSLRGNLLLANLNEEEFKSGAVSVERLVAIRLGKLGSLGSLPFGIKLVVLLAVLAFLASVTGRRGFALALAIAPLARMQIELWNHKEAFGGGDGSIFFQSNARLFRMFSTICGIVLWIVLYRYAREHGAAAALRQFLSASVAQIPLYIVLKLVCSSEILLIPVAVVGVGLSFGAFP